MLERLHEGQVHAGGGQVVGGDGDERLGGVGGVGLFDLERQQLVQIGGRLADAGEIGGVVVERLDVLAPGRAELAVRIGEMAFQAASLIEPG